MLVRVCFCLMEVGAAFCIVICNFVICNVKLKFQFCFFKKILHLSFISSPVERDERSTKIENRSEDDNELVLEVKLPIFGVPLRPYPFKVESSRLSWIWVQPLLVNLTSVYWNWITMNLMSFYRLIA